EAKHGKRSSADSKKAAEGLMAIISDFAPLREKDPSDAAVQAQVKKLQDFISENYYSCTKETLSGLGKMYAAGGDFTKNIDAAPGEGAASFINEAIQIYTE
ncbi:MAG: TipAS antibiotic-recognition domain-containing protein, partial [Clostridiales bacterium]|nr:TipAS antibiotic-recognition domain-containing protein [Clostridiales bacterium]